MTPQLEEAERFLRLAKRDQTAFKALLNVTTVDPAVACFHAQQAAAGNWGQIPIKPVCLGHELNYFIALNHLNTLARGLNDGFFQEMPLHADRT